MLPRGNMAKSVAAVLAILLVFPGAGVVLAGENTDEGRDEVMPPDSVLPGPLTYVLALVLLVVASGRHKVHRSKGGDPFRR